MREHLPERIMADRASLGVIALVRDAWHDIVMPRHHVLKRLAKHYPLVWLEPPADFLRARLERGDRFAGCFEHLMRSDYTLPIFRVQTRRQGQSRTGS